MGTIHEDNIMVKEKLICTEIIFHNKIKEDQKDRLRK